MMQTLTNRIEERAQADTLKALLTSLGITDELIAKKNLTFFKEPQKLVSVDRDIYGRQVTLEPEAAEAWNLMKRAAGREGIALHGESGFRSYEHQAQIIRSQLKAGKSIEVILERVAPPGYSEHNSGRAVDVCNNTSLIHDLGQDFDKTLSFAWLTKNAAAFGFVMSFPKDNKAGYMYEPWHWVWRPSETFDLGKASLPRS